MLMEQLSLKQMSLEPMLLQQLSLENYIKTSITITNVMRSNDIKANFFGGDVETNTVITNVFEEKGFIFSNV